MGIRRHLVASIAVALTLIVTTSASAKVSPNNRWGLPTGAYAGKAPIGWVLVVHGGVWAIVGPAAVAVTEPDADFFRAHGWGTYSIDYRQGAKSLTDVNSAYDHLRATVPPTAPVCAWGASAGGNLVMLLAAHRRTLKCLISQAAPTDLLTISSEPAGPATPDSGLTPVQVYADYAVPLFGAPNLRAWSPVQVASSIDASMLLGASSLDPTVPVDQMLEMKAVLPARTQTMLLAGATTLPLNFTHASVTPAALTAWQRAELRLLAHTTRRRSDR